MLNICGGARIRRPRPLPRPGRVRRPTPTGMTLFTMCFDFLVNSRQMDAKVARRVIKKLRTSRSEQLRILTKTDWFSDTSEFSEDFKTRMVSILERVTVS